MPPLVTLDAAFIAAAREMLEKTVLITPGRLQADELTQRGTYSFGYNYNKMRKGDNSFVPLPDFLFELCSHARDKLAHASGLSLPRATHFNNCIISVYEPGFRLKAHIDNDKSKTRPQGGAYNFYFGKDIIGVVITADSEGGLYLTDRVDENETSPAARCLPEQDGTAFLLHGHNRHRPHGVSPIRKRRISVTYRTVEFC